MSSFTVTDATMNIQNFDTPQCVIHLDYQLCESDGSKYNIRRTNTAVHDMIDDVFARVANGIIHAKAQEVADEIIMFENINRDREKFLRGDLWIFCLAQRYPIISRTLIQAAAPPAPNPYQVAAIAIQNQLTLATQTNTELQNTITQQNAHIANLRNQAEQLQQTITSLRASITEISRTQQTVISSLQTIPILEQQVANLTTILHDLLTRIS